MLGIAMADLHLSYVGPGRVVNGRSGREADVEAAWFAAVDRAIEAQPDLISISGDCFHSPRPSFHAVRAFQSGVRRMIQATKAHLVVIPGNHCSPKTLAALSPNIVIDGFSDRVHYVDEVKAIILTVASGERVAVTCAPFSALGPDVSYALEPVKGVDANVLVIHAAVRTSSIPNALPHFYGNEGIDIGREADRWDAICAGDYHEYQPLHPTALAFYSGSIERTSSNIWQESSAKGIVRYDTTARTMELLEIPTRLVASYDLNDFEEHPQPTAEFVNHALGQIYNAGFSADAIVRLNAQLPRSERDQLDWKLIRDLKARCFHFVMNIEWLATDPQHPLGDRRATRGITLSQSAAEFFANDPEDVKACALGYLEDA